MWAFKAHLERTHNNQSHHNKHYFVTAISETGLAKIKISICYKQCFYTCKYNLTELYFSVLDKIVSQRSSS